QVTIKPFYDDLEEFSAPNVNEEEVHLLEVFRQEKTKVHYTYDFGNSWEHDVLLEKMLPTDPSLMLPICTAAKGVAPEEDSGIEEIIEADWTEEELLDMINEELSINEMLEDFDEMELDLEILEELFDWVDVIKKLKPWHYLSDAQI